MAADFGAQRRLMERPSSTGKKTASQPWAAPWTGAVMAQRSFENQTDERGTDWLETPPRVPPNARKDAAEDKKGETEETEEIEVQQKGEDVAECDLLCAATKDATRECDMKGCLSEEEQASLCGKVDVARMVGVALLLLLLGATIGYLVAEWRKGD